MIQSDETIVWSYLVKHSESGGPKGDKRVFSQRMTEIAKQTVIPLYRVRYALLCFGLRGQVKIVNHAGGGHSNVYLLGEW